MHFKHRITILLSSFPSHMQVKIIFPHKDGLGCKGMISGEESVNSLAESLIQ